MSSCWRHLRYVIGVILIATSLLLQQPLLVVAGLLVIALKLGQLQIRMALFT